MHGRAVWVGVCGILSLLLLPRVARAQCTKDTDCKGDRVCEAGKCTSPVAPTQAAPAPPAAPPAVDGAAPLAAPPAVDGAAPPVTPAGAEHAPATPPVEAVAAVETQPAPAARASAKAAAPAPLVKDEPALRRRSRAAMVSGIVMVSVGPLALLGALAAKNSQDSCDEELERDYPDHIVPTSQKFRVERCDGYSTPLYVLGIGGALLTAAGVPLIIYGAKTVPSGRAQLQLSPWATPAAGGLKLRLTL